MKRSVSAVGILLGSILLAGQLLAAPPTPDLAPGEYNLIVGDYTFHVRPSPSPSLTDSPSPSPTASPTLEPSASPTPSPTLAPTPVPTPAASADPWAVAFGSRPASGPISLSGAACQNVTISNKTFRNLGPNVISISLSHCNGVTIDSVDFDHVAEGVLAVSSQNITIRNSRYNEILGPSLRDGHNRANFAQFGSVSGFLIEHNKGKGGDTEDIISLYQTSNGRVTGNHFQGTNWSSASGTGVIIGDSSGGNNVEVDHNILNCPGQVGITFINGDRSSVHDNVLYCAPRPGQTTPNVAISTYFGTVTNASVSNNRVYWRRNDGAENPYWWGAGTPTQVGNNWHDTTINPTAIAVTL